ncbi:MAG: hypothetical protein ACKV19_05380, partial [Verrucomicrobiales bacterium]
LVVATHRALMVMENDGVGRFRLRRRLAAVYSGPVGIAQLTADLALLTAAPEAELARLSPRPGRWLVDPRLIDRAAYTSDLAAHFASHGFPNEAQRLYAMAPPQGGPGRAPDLFNQAKPT